MLKKFLILLLLLPTLSNALFEENQMKKLKKETKYLLSEDIVKIKDIEGSFKQQSKLYERIIKKEKDLKKLDKYIKKYVFLLIEEKKYRKLDSYLKRILLTNKATSMDIGEIEGLISFIYSNLAFVNYKMRNFSKSDYYLKVIKGELKDQRSWLLAKLEIEGSGKEARIIRYLIKNINILKKLKDIDKLYILKKVYEITKKNKEKYNPKNVFFIEKRILDLLETIDLKNLFYKEKAIYLDSLLEIKEKISNKEFEYFLNEIEKSGSLTDNLKIKIGVSRVEASFYEQKLMKALMNINKTLKIKMDKKSGKYKYLLEIKSEIKYLANKITKEELLNRLSNINYTSLGKNKEKIVFLEILRKISKEDLDIFEFNNEIEKLNKIQDWTFKRYGFKKERIKRISKYSLVKKIINKKDSSVSDKKKEKAKLLIKTLKEIKIYNNFINNVEEVDNFIAIFSGVESVEVKRMKEIITMKLKKERSESLDKYKRYFFWKIENEKIEINDLIEAEYLITQFILKEDLKNLRELLEVSVVIANKLERHDFLIEVYKEKLDFFNDVQKLWFLENLYVKSKNSLDYLSKKELLTEIVKLLVRSQNEFKKIEYVSYLMKENYDNFQEKEALETFDLIKENLIKVLDLKAKLNIEKIAYLSYKKRGMKVNAKYWQNQCLKEEIIEKNSIQKEILEKIKEECK